MHNKKIITFIALNVPSEQGVGWEKRSMAFLRAYSRIARIRLLCIPAFDSSPINHEKELCKIRDLCEYADLINPSLDERSHGKYRYNPWDMDVSWNTLVHQKVDKAIHDASLVHVMRLGGYTTVMGKVPDNKILLDMDEHPVAKNRLERNVTRSYRHNALHSFTMKTVRIFFKDLVTSCFLNMKIRNFSRTFVCSADEKQHFSPNKRIVSILNPVPMVDSKRNGIDKDRRKILFAGNLYYEPNIDALQYFAIKILPLILKHEPDTELLIVGRSPADSISNLFGHPNISIAMDVEEVLPYYEQAAISIAPIRFGGGTRIKILEAFAFRVPVVATPFGYRGLDVTPGKHLLSADRPEAFADACIELFKNKELGKSLEHNAYYFVKKHHSYDSVEKKIIQVVEPVLALDGK